MSAAPAVVLICLAAASASAATYPPGFEEQTIVSGLTIPTTAAWAPDGRIFIAEKSGVLKVLNPGDTTATTILDISDQVNDSFDRGLLGIAVDADYETNHYVYLLYTAELHPLMADTDAPTFSQLRRIQVSGSNAVTDEQILLGTSSACVTENFQASWPSGNGLDCIPSEGRSHSIGTVISAPDGTLYVGSGDASSYAEFDPLAFRVYDETSFAGKILHVDRDGKGLPGHSFCSGDNDLTHVCTKLYAKGFRNPFRFKWRNDGTPDGALNVGDVGWNTREEVDFIGTPGHSYGWPCYEGTIQTPVYQDTTPPKPNCADEYAKPAGTHLGPNYDYLHSATNAIIGGPIYPGGPYPDGYDGDMFFGDYSAGFMKVLNLDAGGAVTGTTDFASGWGGVDLILTPDGELAFPDFGTGEPGTGSLKRIVYAPSTGTPNAVATATPVAGAKPLSVDFSAAGSLDPEGQPLTYDWDFDDGTPHSSAVAPTHIYANAGEYHPVVTVDDGDGHTDSASVTVNVFNSPPTPVISSPVDGSTYHDGDLISLSGSATDAQDGPLSGSALMWTVTLHHGAHTHQAGTFTGNTVSFTAQRDHDSNSYYEVRLRATDSENEWRQTSIKLYPATVPFDLLSSPSGAPVGYSGVTHTAPFSTQSAIGLRTSVSAGARFTKNGKNYHFVSWADGVTSRVRGIEIPDHASSVTAVYHEDKAVGQSASATSVQGDDPAFAASKATDDNPATRWSSKGQAPGLDPNPSWQVDLGSVRSVSAVELDWETAYASRYDILTSIDGAHWTVVANESIGGPIKRRTTFTTRRARYVKVNVVAHGTSFGVSFYEARVLGPPDGDPVPEDKAAGRPATASSTQFGPFSPGAAVDEDSATRWSSTSADGQWWQVDLGSEQAVDAVELNWETAYASEYQIQTSLDGTIFTTAETVNITKPGLERTTFASRMARYVRVLGVTRATLFGISFWDARVYGGSGVPPDTTPPETTITSGPSGTTPYRSATFAFQSEPGASFECSLDGAAFSGCTSPQSYEGLVDGAHSFAVRARDTAGNIDPTPATRDWTVAQPSPPTSFRDVVLGTPGLIGLWPLGDPGSTAGNLADAAGGRYRGGPVRVGALVAGTPDGARHFDGRDDRVAVAARGLSSPKRLTLALWVKREQARGSARRVLVMGARAPLADGFTLLLDARGRPVFALGGKRGRHASLTGPPLAKGRTYQLTAGYDGRRMSIYVNARRRAQRAYAGGIAYPRGWSLSFGGPARRRPGLAGFAGVLDEIALFGTPLGQPALAQQFQLGSGGG